MVGPHCPSLGEGSCRGRVAINRRAITPTGSAAAPLINLNLAPIPWPHQSAQHRGLLLNGRRLQVPQQKATASPAYHLSISLAWVGGNHSRSPAAGSGTAPRGRPTATDTSRRHIHDAAAHCLRRTLYAYRPPSPTSSEYCPRLPMHL